MSIVFFPPDKVKFLVVKEISKKRKYKSKLCDTFLSQSSFSNTKYKNFLIIQLYFWANKDHIDLSNKTTEHESIPEKLFQWRVKQEADVEKYPINQTVNESKLRPGRIKGILPTGDFQRG